MIYSFLKSVTAGTEDKLSHSHARFDQNHDTNSTDNKMVPQ